MRRFKTRTGLVGLMAAVALGLLTGSAVAQDLGDRTVSVSPDENLQDGDVVTVEWSGYDPNSSLAVIQCESDTGLKSEICNTEDAAFEVDAGDEGQGSVELTLRTGDIGPDGECQPGDTCYVAVNQDLEDGLTVTAPITFAAAGESAGSDELPRTGADPLLVLFLGGGLLLAGAGMVTASTRRQASR